LIYLNLICYLKKRNCLLCNVIHCKQKQCHNSSQRGKYFAEISHLLKWLTRYKQKKNVKKYIFYLKRTRKLQWTIIKQFLTIFSRFKMPK
jgi:hypothetical protein